MLAATLPLTPATAIERLKDLQAKYWMIDAEAAIERLGCLLGRTDILTLYQHYFPKAYRESQASPWCPGPDGHSLREQEFFSLVRDQLFPIADLCFDWDRERLDYIPVETCALDPEGIEDWKVAWQVIYGLVQGVFAEEVSWNAVQAFLPGASELPFFVTTGTPYSVDWRRFFRRASRSDPHLKHLREACDYAAYNTGNVWLDTTEEMLGYSELPDWDRETIDWLAAEWRKAGSILRHANEPVD